MRILVGSSNTDAHYQKALAENLGKHGIDYVLINNERIYNLKSWIKHKRKFHNLIKEFKPDLIFLNFPGYFGLNIIKTKIPLFIHLQGDYWHDIKCAKECEKNPIKRMILHIKERIAKKHFENSTAIIPVSYHTKNIIDKHYPGKSTEPLYPATDPSIWYETKRMKLKHPCVGLLQNTSTWGKAKELLILKQILDKMPEVTFYWAGDGIYLNKILPELSKFPNFNYIGPLEYPNKVREYLNEIDVYALISGVDSFGRTILEAQLMKKPIVATNVGGVPEALGDKGLLVEKGNADGYIKKLYQQLNNLEPNTSGRWRVESMFNLDNATNTFLNIIEKKLNKPQLI